MQDPDATISLMLDAYRTAVYERDVDALMRLYAAQVRVFDTWGVWSYEGAPAWRKSVEGWLTSLGSDRVRVTFDDVQVSGGVGFAIASAFTTFTGLSSEGAPLRSMQNRMTWAVQGSGAGARIVHEHTSAPVGFEDMKAILKR